MITRYRVAGIRAEEISQEKGERTGTTRFLAALRRPAACRCAVAAVALPGRAVAARRARGEIGKGSLLLFFACAPCRKNHF